MSDYIKRNVVVLDRVFTPEPIKSLLEKYVVRAGELMGNGSFVNWDPDELDISREDAITDPDYAYDVLEYGEEVFQTKEEEKILQDWWKENDLGENTLITVWW